MALLRLEDPACALLDHLDPVDIRRALARLPMGERVVTALSLADDLSYREIALVLALPIATVRSRLHRGRALLKLGMWETAADRGLQLHARPAGLPD